jgi:5-methylcytosine-specific restriction protein B
MARVRDIIQGGQSVKAHKLENSVTCQYQVIHDDYGAILLHLSTFGSDQRASSSKSSQSIQLDRDNAKELMDILMRTFGF